MTTFAEANPDIDPFELGAILEISSYAEFAEVECQLGIPAPVVNATAHQGRTTTLRA
jgi:hypothetical protein